MTEQDSAQVAETRTSEQNGVRRAPLITGSVRKTFYHPVPRAASWDGLKDTAHDLGLWNGGLGVVAWEDEATAADAWRATQKKPCTVLAIRGKVSRFVLDIQDDTTQVTLRPPQVREFVRLCDGARPANGSIATFYLTLREEVNQGGSITPMRLWLAAWCAGGVPHLPDAAVFDDLERRAALCDRLTRLGVESVQIYLPMPTRWLLKASAFRVFSTSHPTT